MKIVLQQNSFKILNVEAELIEKLGWNHKEALRLYAQDGLLVIEKFEQGSCIQLYKFSNMQKYSRRIIACLPKPVIETLGWHDRDNLMGFAYNNKLIIGKFNNPRPMQSRGCLYIMEKLDYEKRILPKIRKWFECDDYTLTERLGRKDWVTRYLNS